MVENREKREENSMEVERKNLSHLHTVRFYNLPPRGITCMAYNAEQKKLALSRSDASIEVWSVSATPFMERVIFGAPNASIEALAWVNGALLSAGLSGEIVYWNLRKLEPQQSLMVTGSSVWCLDVHKNVVAAGTEEGYLNICRMEDDFLAYERMFDRQEGRILCCRFSPTGEYLATGSMDAVRVWNVQNGHALHRMTLVRVEKRKEIVVWAIEYLPDDVVVSADSSGKITFWDSKLGCQTESYQALKADALCLAKSEDSSRIFISGTEPVIRTYTLTAMKKDNQVVKKWVKSVEKYHHSHDVKALSVAENHLFSGGVDSHLVISALTTTRTAKFAPFLRQTSGEVTENRLLLLRYLNHVEVWQLASLDNTQELQKLLEVQSRDQEAIVSSSLSPSGEILLYSTDTQIKMFQFDSSTRPALLTPLRITAEQFSPCLHAFFARDSKTLVLVKASGQVDVFTITSQMDLDHVQTIETHKYIKDVIHLACFDGRFLVLVGLCNSVVVWRFEKTTKRWKRHINLPKYTNPPTAMCIHPASTRLVVVYLDGKMIEYDLEELQFTFSVHIAEEALQRPISNIALDPRNQDLYILQDENSIFSIRKLQEDENATEDGQNQGKKSRNTSDSNEQRKFSKKIIREAKHLAFLAWLGDEELVAVEISPDSFLEQLPAPLKIKKFGTG
ncbi:U3 small nucleolar RNA-associated protein 4 homolog [Phlebotomus argentipes]|uniref:U3 small nucleolar RNA-associated protein 4 homolog n=1 Tax=Phlebotomus argentipes TaxID=94469 RepID=UPI0028937C65|nr:U3 small nucleolar RNA-associated protein 4 homolog [Phlebotomus argentipes]